MDEEATVSEYEEVIIDFDLKEDADPLLTSRSKSNTENAEGFLNPSAPYNEGEDSSDVGTDKDNNSSASSLRNRNITFFIPNASAPYDNNDEEEYTNASDNDEDYKVSPSSRGSSKVFSRKDNSPRSNKWCACCTYAVRVLSECCFDAVYWTASTNLKQCDPRDAIATFQDLPYQDGCVQGCIYCGLQKGLFPCYDSITHKLISATWFCSFGLCCNIPISISFCPIMVCCQNMGCMTTSACRFFWPECPVCLPWGGDTVTSAKELVNSGHYCCAMLISSPCCCLFCATESDMQLYMNKCDPCVHVFTCDGGSGHCEICLPFRVGRKSLTAPCVIPEDKTTTMQKLLYCLFWPIHVPFRCFHEYNKDEHGYDFDLDSKHGNLTSQHDDGNLAKVTRKYNWATCINSCVKPLRRVLATRGDECKYTSHCIETTSPNDTDCCCQSSCLCAIGMFSIIVAPIAIPLSYVAERCYRAPCCCCCFSTHQYQALHAIEFTDHPFVHQEQEQKQEQEREQEHQMADYHWLYGSPLSIACESRSFSSSNVEKTIEANPQAANIRGTDGHLPLHHLLMHKKADAELVRRVASATNECKACLEFALEKNLIDYRYVHVPTSDETIRKDMELYGRISHCNTRDTKSVYYEKNEKAKLINIVSCDLPLSGKRGDSWFFLLKTDLITTEYCKQVVDAVFNKHPTQWQALCYSKDEKGRRAIDVAGSVMSAHMKSIVMFMSRYDVNVDAPVHTSATAIVFYAEDNKIGYAVEEKRRVAIKFMQSTEQFEKELSCRAQCSFNEEYVINIIDTSTAAESRNKLQSEFRKLRLEQYSHYIVMPAAEKNLKSVIDSTSIAGKRWEEIKTIVTHVANALGHVHSKNYIHGDIKPLNICQMANGHFTLIDFDASVRWSPEADAEFAGAKYSSAFLPPEMIFKDESTGQLCVRSNQVKAHPSQDMWAFGCVLFQLFSGETLFLSNDEDNLTGQRDLYNLQNWGRDTDADHQFFQLERLHKIKNPLARHLVSQLLYRDPRKRLPSMQHVLNHAFLTGKTNVRLPGNNDALFDIFLSYRDDSDRSMAEAIYNILIAKGLRVWWDKRCLADGVDWERGFCAGIMNSRAFVPLISAAAIEERFKILQSSSRCDNVLLEHRLSLELQQRGLIEFIFPVFVSPMVISSAGIETYEKYYPSWSSSSAVVDLVESKLTHHLLKEGQGLPLLQPMSVISVLENICKHNGDFVMSQTPTDASVVRTKDEILRDITNRISNLFAPAPAVVLVTGSSR